MSGKRCAGPGVGGVCGRAEFIGDGFDRCGRSIRRCLTLWGRVDSTFEGWDGPAVPAVDDDDARDDSDLRRRDILYPSSM